MTKTSAVKAMVILTAAYPQDIPEPTLELYCDSLSDLPEWALIQACRGLVLNSRWLPRISEIREAAFRLSDPQAFPPPVWDAWAEVIDTIQGSDRTTQWSHPLIAKIIKGLGGYNAVARASDADRIRGQFMTMYGKASETSTKTLLTTDASIDTLGSGQSRKGITRGAETN